MPSPALTRRPYRPRADLCVLPVMRLAQGRLHEACGPARQLLALWIARAVTGPVLWIRPAWDADQLNPDGVRDWIDPARLITLSARRADDLLWAAEEGLRAGAVELVVAELPTPPGLTPVRRLHLAAQTGAAEGGCRPLGLILTPDTGGAQGVESRWSLTPRHRFAQAEWRLARLRARTDPPAEWAVTLDQSAPPGAPLPEPVCTPASAGTAQITEKCGAGAQNAL